jgi:hypothetical protein
MLVNAMNRRTKSAVGRKYYGRIIALVVGVIASVQLVAAQSTLRVASRSDEAATPPAGRAPTAGVTSDPQVTGSPSELSLRGVESQRSISRPPVDIMSGLSQSARSGSPVPLTPGTHAPTSVAGVAPGAADLFSGLSTAGADVPPQPLTIASGPVMRMILPVPASPPSQSATSVEDGEAARGTTLNEVPSRICLPGCSRRKRRVGQRIRVLRSRRLPRSLLRARSPSCQPTSPP